MYRKKLEICKANGKMLFTLAKHSLLFTNILFFINKTSYYKEVKDNNLVKCKQKS